MGKLSKKVSYGNQRKVGINLFAYGKLKTAIAQDWVDTRIGWRSKSRQTHLSRHRYWLAVADGNAIAITASWRLHSILRSC
jgi:hypothetical protein